MKYLLFPVFVLMVWSLQGQPFVSGLHPDFYYNQAIAHFQSSDYKVSGHLLDEYLKSETTPEALYYRAMSSVYTREKAGEYHVRNFLKEYPLHPLAHKAQFELAHLYFVDQNYPKASLAYGEMEPESLEPKQREQAYFEKGYSLVQMNVKEQGKESLKSAYDLKGGYLHPSAYYLGTLSEGTVAITYFEEASRSDEWKMRSAVYLSRHYLTEKQYEKVITWNEPMLNDDQSTENYDLHIYTAEANYHLEKYRPAVRLYEKAQTLNVRKPEGETLFKMGHSYYVLGERKKAIDNLKMAGLNETATGQASAYQLGLIYTDVEDFSSALHAFEIAARGTSDPNIKVEAAFMAGKVSVKMEQYSQAIVKLEEFTRTYPQSKHFSEANDLLSSAYLNTSNYDLVIAHFERQSSRSEVLRRNYQKVTLVKGMQLFSDRKLAEAIVSLKKSTNTPVVKRYEIDAWYWLGETYFIQGDVENARQAYTKVKSLDSNNGMADYGLGYLAYNQKKYAEAKEAFQAFLRKDRTSKMRTDAAMRIADCDYAQKNYQEALDGYSRLLGSGVAQDYINFQIGLIHQMNGRTKQAVDSYAKVLSQSKSSYRNNALFQTAQSYFENAQFKEAETAYTSYISQYPNGSLVVQAYIRRGQCHMNQGAYESARQDYVLVMERHIAHPASQNALLGLQEVQKQGVSVDFERYLAAYKTAHPDDASLETIEFEQGKSLYFSQNYTQAILKFEELLKKYLNSGYKEDVTYYLADAYDRSGNSAAANEHYEKILTNPASSYYTRVLDKRGRLLLSTGQGQKAIDNYLKLLETSNNRKESYLANEGLMKAYYLNGNYDKVLEATTGILNAEWKPSNAENQAYLYRGKAYEGKQQPDNALDEYLKVVNNGTDEIAAEANYSIGLLLHQQTRYQQSLETLFKLNSTFGAYQLWIGKSFLLIADNYIAMNELLQAKATLQSLIDQFPDEQIRNQAKQKLQMVTTLQNQQPSTEKPR